MLLQKPSPLAVLLLGAVLCTYWVPAHQQSQPTAATTAAPNPAAATATAKPAATPAAPTPAAPKPAVATKKSKVVEVAPEADVQNDVDDINTTEGMH